MSPSSRLAASLDGRDLSSLATETGLSLAIVSRAAIGRSVNASAYLALCSAVGIDPVSGKRRGTPKLKHGTSILWCIVGSGLTLKRRLANLSLRAAADVIGSDAATLLRCERGEAISLQNFLRITQFIGVHPDGFTKP